MQTFLWVLQIVLAVTYIVTGVVKLTTQKLKLEPRMGFVEDFSSRSVKLIGAAEVLGALGLVLPAATDVAPILTPLAAAGLAALMAGAVLTHVRRHENALAVAPAILLVMDVLVAWGRFAT